MFPPLNNVELTLKIMSLHQFVHKLVRPPMLQHNYVFLYGLRSEEDRDIKRQSEQRLFSKNQELN